MDVVPLVELDDTRFASALEVVQRDERNLDPAIPPMTDRELRLYAADDRTEGNRHFRAAVVDGGRVRAVAHLELDDDDNNRHFASAEVFGGSLDPDAGRAGIEWILDLAEADRRTSLMGWGPDTPVEHGFWTGLGAGKRYAERMSELDVTAVDAELMQHWIDQRTDRAADVELARWVDTCPDHLLDAWAVSRTAMNDAPKEGIEVNDWSISAADVREDEDARRALGTRVRNVFATDPRGAPVGHTSVHVNPFRPAASWQWDTVVLDHHRRRGIGRWLKAEMWQWLRETEPAVTRLRTGNAESNAAMLAINVAMGFREAAVLAAWQAPISAYRAALA